ncbi:MAG: mycofactocin biosynthesis glycosyltransferase MftF [Acidimicrobiales bacterium]
MAVADSSAGMGAGSRGGLPGGFRIVLDAGVRRLDGGAVLRGGAPLRLLRLTSGGRRLVERLVAGEEVPPTPGAQRLVRRLLASGIGHPVPPLGSLTTDDVTVVIPTRDSSAGLARTLLTLGPAGRVVVVDDGSADAVATEAVVREHRAELLRHDRSLGPGVARESGWRMASTPVVAFVDSECEPTSGWLAALLSHLADPEVAAAAPRIASGDGSGWLGAYERVRSPLDMGARPGPARPRSWVPYVPTAALVVRRDALIDIDGFDRDLRYGEDVDLTWRLAQAGWTVRYEPTVIVSHPPRKTVSAWARQRVAYGTSAAPLARRHGRAVAPLAVSMWSALVWVLAALGFRKSAFAVGLSTTALLVPKLRVLDRPVTEAVHLAGLGHLHAGRSVADAVRRSWWPIALAAALISRRARRGVAVAFVLPPVVEWVSARPAGIGPLRWLVARAADDCAYAAGVWAGCWHERSATALVPDLSSWPGRRAAVES